MQMYVDADFLDDKTNVPLISSTPYHDWFKGIRYKSENSQSPPTTAVHL